VPCITYKRVPGFPPPYFSLSLCGEEPGNEAILLSRYIFKMKMAVNAISFQLSIVVCSRCGYWQDTASPSGLTVCILASYPLQKTETAISLCYYLWSLLMSQWIITLTLALRSWEDWSVYTVYLTNYSVKYTVCGDHSWKAELVQYQPLRTDLYTVYLTNYHTIPSNSFLFQGISTSSLMKIH